MDHFVSAKAIVGAGDAATVLEVRGQSVRIKRRGRPEFYLPIDIAVDVAAFLRAAGGQRKAEA